MPVKIILKGPEDKIDFTSVVKLNQGSGSGLDSDLLDGLHASVLELIANKDVNNGYAGLNASGLVIKNPASKGQANGLAELDAGGKVPSAQLPALALTDIYTVASQAEQLALTAQEGDVAIRTDQNKSYAHNGGTAGTMADWSELLTPTDTVLSWNNRIGAVMPQSGDYNLTDITNRSHTLLTDIGTNTHAQIDTHLGASSGIHGVVGSVVGTEGAQTLISKTLQDVLIKDTDPTPVGDVLFKVLDGIFEFRNQADTAKTKCLADAFLVGPTGSGTGSGGLSFGDGRPTIGHNARWDGSQWVRVDTGNPSQILFSEGFMSLRVGAYGGLGTTIDWEESLRLETSKGPLLRIFNNAPSDASLNNGTYMAWVDQTTHLLTFRVKYSDGTLKTGTVALV